MREEHCVGTTRRRVVRAWLPTLVRDHGQWGVLWLRRYERIDRWHPEYPEYTAAARVPGYWQTCYRQTRLRLNK